MAHITTKFRSRLSVGVSCGALLLAAPVLAQEPASTLVDEVVVTVNRVEQNLQDVPAAVNVMSAQAIEDLGISDINDVMRFTPGAFPQPGAPDQSSVAIRGISADAYGASGDAAVVTMIDNAVISRTWMRSSAMFDLQRVEVARGPQGTSFGRNATAGVVHFLTRRPVLENEGYVSVDAGNYNSFESTAVVNRRMNDSVAARFGAYYSRRDGYFRDERTGRGLDNADAAAVRGQVLFSPSEDLEVLIRGSYGKEHMDVPNPAALTDPLIPVLYPADLIYTAAGTNPRHVGANPGQFFDRTLWDLGVEARLERGDVNVTSVTDYRDGRSDVSRDLWGTTTGVLRQESFEDAQVFQQEFRIDNSGAASALQWVGGLYYLHEDTVRFEQKNILTGTEAAHFQDFMQKNKTDSIGVFVSGSYHLTDSTVLAGGARYSYDRKRYKVPFHTCGLTPNPTGIRGLGGGEPAPFCPAFIQDYPAVSYVSGAGKAHWDNVSYRISVTQQFGDDINVYASYATGYKGGGFGNEPSNDLAESFAPYDPEEVAAIEVGVKVALLDRRLRIDLAAYTTDYDDIQAEAILPNTGSNVVFNVGGATIKGVEGQFDWRVTDRFTLSGNAAYIDAVYDDPGLVAPDGTIISTGRFRDVPLWTAYLSAAYERPLKGGSSLRYYVDARSRADRTSDIGPQGQPEIVTPGDTILGARLTWTNADGDLRLSLWGRNLTNEDDFVNVEYGTAADQTFEELGLLQGIRRAGPPRTFGAALNYQF